MNLFELLIFIFNCFVGYRISLYFGNFESIGFSILYFIFGFLILPAIVTTYVQIRAFLYKGDKWMPACICGSENLIHEKYNDCYYITCQNCKTKFTKKNEIAFIVGENLVEKEYKRKIILKGWV